MKKVAQLAPGSLVVQCFAEGYDQIFAGVHCTDCDYIGFNHA